MKKWQQQFNSKPIKHQAAEVEAAVIKDLYSSLGEECDKAVADGASGTEALRACADRIEDTWLREGFIRLYKKFRPENFA